jgi:pimeloyl-ACP methyl ester carboxylesterase
MAVHPQLSPDRETIVRLPDAPHKMPPVVFVHGAWHAAWCWDEYFLAYFARHGYPAYAFSFRRHGTSAGSTSLRRCRIADYVADLAAFVQQFPAPPILVGHSMGGLVVQKYLERASVPAAVLLASVPPQGALQATLRTIKRIPWQFIKANLQLRLYPLVETPELTRAAFFSRALPEAALLKYFRLIQDESYLAFLDMLLLSLPRPGRVATPLLVLGAEQDAIFRPHEVRATALSYGTEAVLFPDMAHDMMLEPNWQAVADTIIGWLGRLQQPGSDAAASNSAARNSGD